jgi:hypothetical protein
MQIALTITNAFYKKLQQKARQQTSFQSLIKTSDLIANCTNNTHSLSNKHPIKSLNQITINPCAFQQTANENQSKARQEAGNATGFADALSVSLLTK